MGQRRICSVLFWFYRVSSEEVEGTMIDHIETVSVFQNYTKNYNEALKDIDRKILHTFRVAKAAEMIAEGMGLGSDDIDLAWFLGILHDTGRFEQERRYGTFVDAFSVDHAELGADILFVDGLIDRYPTDGLQEGWRSLCETAVRLHNKLALPPDLDPRTRLFCQLIRDADKTDIFRVIATTPFEDIAGAGRSRFTDEPEAGKDLMDCVCAHQCVPRKLVKSVFDNTITYCCMAFDLELKVTRTIVKEQGYLLQLLQGGENEKQIEQLRITRAEIEKAWGLKL